MWRLELSGYFVSNSAMENNKLIEQRLIDLEIKASFSEDLLDELNRVIVRQQDEIAALVREVQALRLKTPDGDSTGFTTASQELPPHY